MKILFCTTELQPFSQVGGLAEFSCFVPRGLSKKGVDIAIITPFYSSINSDAAPIEALPVLEKDDVALGNERIAADFYHSTLPESDIPVYFVKCDPFFSRDGIYTNPADGQGFPDNFRRFAFFQHAVLHLIEKGLLSPDILHLNDHHTALIPAMMRYGQREAGALSGIKTVLTLHNVQYQTECEESQADAIGISQGLFAPEGPYQRHGHINFLKAGVILADRVVAVSETYAEEIRTSYELGHGLTDELTRRGDNFMGILNGVDYTHWNPRTDDLIAWKYSSDTLSKKQKNKEELLANNGLDYSRLDIPTIGMITQLTDSKGFDLLVSVFEKMMTFDLNVVMLGTGEPKYHKLFENIKMRFPHKLGLNLTYSNRMAHAILAGSDFFFMPSRYEPCGQHQMFAMRYGAVPIVHATGGLADTIKDVSEDNREGWGFTFSDYDATQLLKTVWRAVSFYKNKKKFKRIVQRAMTRDFSWDNTAGRYLEVYGDLIA